VEETALQLVLERVDVARHRRVFRAELLGCRRERPRPRNRQKISKVVPVLTWLPFAIACRSLAHIDWEYMALH
jgi:hypothetical protein